MSFIQHSYLIPLLPLVGAAVNGAVSFLGLRRQKITRAIANITACGSVLLSFILSCGLFLELLKLEPEARSITMTWFTWLDLTVLKANVAFLLDPLSVIMCLVVTGVGFLIHVYSIGYMAHDKGYSRFFSYMNLFCFAMLTLVLSDNLLLLFVGWEGVGLCSYLLIGFWFEHKPNAVAGMKAFIVNRIGDLGFLIGILLLFWGLNSIGHASVTFTELREYAPLLSGVPPVGGFALVTLVCIFLFIGACGKSAQIPLYVWLPDAMAGPTPVSALIHAATMVTAGVYVVARLNFLYIMSPASLAIVATVGAVTAIFAATIGFAQNDIKKVLAYSTVSQLGYMFLGLGTGMFASGIFHLVTHAFFKACLFLGAGSVILSMHHEQDIQKMGGLKEHMSKTFWTFLLATLALSGIFPLSGFFSKDEILWQVFSKGEYSHLFYALWIIGLIGAFGTAFYMFRLVARTFFGKLRTEVEHQRDEPDALEDVHADQTLHQPATPQEQPFVITGVLIALAFLSVIGGFMGIPAAIGEKIGVPNLFERWLEPVFARSGVVAQPAPSLVEGFIGHDSGLMNQATTHSSATEYLLMLLSLAVAAAGISLAVWLYTRREDIVEKLTAKFGFIYRVVLNKYYVDEFYQWLIVKRLLWLNDRIKAFDQTIVDGLVNATASLGIFWSAVWGWWDWIFVDGAVNVVADATITAGRKIRRIQTGHIQHYFYVALLGLIILVVWRVF